MVHTRMNSATSATLVDRRREETLQSITRNARVLADERGLDGFTMDDLAAAVGVSRRTLFNYVPGKIDAVIGPDRPVDEVALETFRSGGPTGDLANDLRDIAASLLEPTDLAIDDVALLRRLWEREHRLADALRERVVVAIDRLDDAILQREGQSFGLDRARVLTRLTLAMVIIAVEEFTTDPTISVTERFLRTFDTVRELFA